MKQSVPSHLILILTLFLSVTASSQSFFRHRVTEPQVGASFQGPVFAREVRGLSGFIVTLGGMFLARGVGQWISLESIPIYNPFIANLSAFSVPVGKELSVPFLALLFLFIRFLPVISIFEMRTLVQKVEERGKA